LPRYRFGPGGLACFAFARQQKNDSALAQQYERAAKHRATELEFMDELKRLTDGEPAE
jgi:hypothetical protein